LRIAVEALTDAADQDRATGGVDLQRGIFPIVQFCTAGGIERASDDDVAGVYRTIMEERTR
jgi:proteasome beta subunit